MYDALLQYKVAAVPVVPQLKDNREHGDGHDRNYHQREVLFHEWKVAKVEAGTCSSAQCHARNQECLCPLPLRLRACLPLPTPCTCLKLAVNAVSTLSVKVG